MAQQLEMPSSSPQGISRSYDPRPGSQSPGAGSNSRDISTARLASPVRPIQGSPSHHRSSSEAPTIIDPIPLTGINSEGLVSGTRRSALAAALETAYGKSPPRFGTSLRAASPAISAQGVASNDVRTNYGSFPVGSLPGPAIPAANEDREVIKRHLVRSSDLGINPGSSRAAHRRDSSGQQSQLDGPDLDDFSSLQLQGGDVTRGVYKWVADAEAEAHGSGRYQRSKSFVEPRPEPDSEVLDINSIKVPGGFRRNYLRRSARTPSPSMQGEASNAEDDSNAHPRQPRLFTNSFLEWLTLYGHFAGEELEDDENERDDYFGDEFYHGFEDPADGDEREPGEGSALLIPKTPGTRRKKTTRSTTGQNTSWGAALLLLKSFVGTGVLFLPKAYLNGGMLFSNLVLLGVASLSYYCFILLVNTRLKIDASFGDMGGILYGRWMRAMILGSIVLSQIGFVAAYIVFTSENLQAFILAVSFCRTYIDIKYMVLMQLIVFLPLSLVRDIAKLGWTALVADFFILLGLIYLYYFDVATLISNRGVSDIIQFNPTDWTLFIGTAIFTFEGIGLIIPIQETMKKPAHFPGVLAAVMLIITCIFVSMGALSYAAFGSSTRTVVLLNLPQGDRFVNAVQFLYSLAILLSTPLQLFPAIRILENELFTRSGKYSLRIKWRKNVFRFVLVMLCAAIAWGGAADLDKFVALVGSFACVPLVYVYPPLLHFKAVATSRRQRIADIVLCVFGVIVMVYTTALTIISWATPSGPPTPGYCD